MLPDALFEQYDMLECKCFMGLFPEIHRAWLTIDHRLFLWNYEDGSDFVSYDELDQIIVSVTLVPPRPGVFIQEIPYVMAIATPIEIVLLGIFLSGSKSSGTITSKETSELRRSTELVLYPTQLSVPSDRVSMLHMIGTEKGRIFMGGQDGHLYELIYQAHEGWFRRRCRKVNHTQSSMTLLMPSFLKWTTEHSIVQLAVENSRNLLFSLSENSTIYAFYLGRSGNSLIRIGMVSGMAHHAQRLCPRTHLLDPKTFKIISIHGIHQWESKYIHLVAITSNGIRLYFTTTPRRSPSIGRLDVEEVSSSGFELVHVRLPPAARVLPSEGHRLTTTISQHVLNNVHTAYYGNGTFLLANAISDTIDNLVCMCPDAVEMSKNSKRYFVETTSEFTIDGKTWAIAELDDISSTTDLDYRRRIVLNELAVQHELTPRTFLLLTNTGLHVLQKIRPVDQLYQLLLISRGQETEGLRRFFERFTRDQACCMCLILACGSSVSPIDSKIIEAPTIRALMSPTRGQPHAEDMSSWAAWIYFRLGGEPRLVEKSISSEVMSEMGRPIIEPEVIYSGTHNGLYMYIARMLRPLWKSPVATKSSINTSSRWINLLSDEYLRHMTDRLISIKKFLDINPFLLNPKRPIERITLSVDLREQQVLEEAAKLEQQSFLSVYQLVVQTLEALAFLRLLHDYSFSSLSEQVMETCLDDLFSTTLEDLVTTTKGRECAREILSILVNKYIREGMSVDAMMEILRDRCPSLFGIEDALLHKGSQLIERAQSSRSSHERDELLRESLELLLKVTHRIPIKTLRSMCQAYRMAGFFIGAVEIPLARARQGDPSDLAIAFYKEGLPAGDSRESVYQERLECYSCVFEVIEDLRDRIALLKTETQQQQSPRHVLGMTHTDGMAHIGRSDGREDDRIIWSLTDMEKAKSMVFQRIAMSDDELFHVTFYDWLLERRAYDDLIEIQSPYLEVYLRERTRETSTNEEIDLLWRFYARNKKFSQASRIQLQLAESEE